MSLLERRSAGLLVLEVKNANPNGDVDANMPRHFISDGRGYISPQSIKRKVRDMLVDHHSPVFEEIVKRMNLDPEAHFIYESDDRGYEDVDPAKAVKLAIALAESDPIAFLRRYYDVRIFGTTLLQKGTKKNKKGPEVEGEYDSFRLVKTGMVTFTIGESVSPIHIESTTTTKKSPVSEDRTDSMAPGGLTFVRHGIYVVRIGVCPNFSKKTGTTQADIDLLKFLLPKMFMNSVSCTRPAGSMNVLRCYWADHKNPLGSFDESEFYSSLTPKFLGGDEESISAEQYEFPNEVRGAEVVDLCAA